MLVSVQSAWKASSRSAATLKLLISVIGPSTFAVDSPAVRSSGVILSFIVPPCVFVALACSDSTYVYSGSTRCQGGESGGHGRSRHGRGGDGAVPPAAPHPQRDRGGRRGAHRPGPEPLGQRGRRRG